jgi:hypothetical protein
MPQFPSRTAPSLAQTARTREPVVARSAERSASLQSSGQAQSDPYRSGEPAATATAFGSGGSAAAVVPARKPEENVTAPAQETKVEVVATGLSAEQVLEIKSTIQAQQKFIGELLEHASRWELEGGELRIYFPSEESAFAGLIEGRETLEKIRASSSKVLARAVRVCAKLESGAARDANASRATSTQQMRAQFENDPMVKSMLQRFGGRISEVRRRTGE